MKKNPENVAKFRWQLAIKIAANKRNSQASFGSR